MVQRIAQHLEEIKNTLARRDLDESATKQGVVLRLLGLAGWDVYNVSEVTPEYTVGGRRVDYALRPNSQTTVFIEVKRNGEILDGHQEQLLDYCFKEGIKLAALTNGRTWWLYLPLQEKNWEQRRFLTIDIESQEPEIVEQRFMDHLSKEKVTTGEAISSAENLVRSQQKTEEANEAIIKAWKLIIETPDEILVDLMSESAEGFCGFKPETEQIREFLSAQGRTLVNNLHPLGDRLRRSAPSAPHPRTPTVGASIQEPQRIDGKSEKPTFFRFQGQDRRVGSWIDVLTELCGILSELRSPDFDRVLSIRRSERANVRWPYHFSRRSEDLRSPKAIPQSDIYVESDLTATEIVALAFRLVQDFGYPQNSLAIQI